MAKRTLLVVDGDPRSRQVLGVSLRKAGFVVTVAESAEEALEAIRLSRPDLVISETRLPHMDGFELCRTIKSREGRLPFIFLTSNDAIDDKLLGLDLGSDDYLTKPIFFQEIVARVRALLQRRERDALAKRRERRPFAGRLADMGILDVFQLMELGRRSGVVRLGDEGGRTGALYFLDGKVVDAETGRLRGEAAAYRLLTWSQGTFKVHFETPTRPERITKSSQSLMMEGMNRLDEWERHLDALPRLDAVLELVPRPATPDVNELDEKELRLERLVDGRRTLIEVVDDSELDDVEALAAIVELYFAGRIKAVGEPVNEPPAADEALVSDQHLPSEVASTSEGDEQQPSLASSEQTTVELKPLPPPIALDDKPGARVLPFRTALPLPRAMSGETAVAPATAAVRQRPNLTEPLPTLQVAPALSLTVEQEHSSALQTVRFAGDERSVTTDELPVIRYQRPWHLWIAACLAGGLIAGIFVHFGSEGGQQLVGATQGQNARATTRPLSPALQKSNSPASVRGATPSDGSPTASASPTRADAGEDTTNLSTAARDLDAGNGQVSCMKPSCKAPSESYMSMMLRARLLLNAGKVKQGETLLGRALMANPSGWEALQELAVLELSRSRNDRALRLARKAIAIEPSAPRAYLVLGTVLQNIGRTKSAKRAYRKFVRLCRHCQYAKEVRFILRQL